MIDKPNLTNDTRETDVTFLLDRTGSMKEVKSQTITAFNEYLNGLKAGSAKILFTFLQFDSESLDVLCRGMPIGDVVPLNDRTFVPRAMTPLVDAAYKTITAVAERVAGRDVKVVVNIQTDGDENCSTEHTFPELAKLISEKTKLGWQFNFMGCGIDSYKQSAKMGISRVDTVSYSADEISTRSIFASAASNTRSFAAGDRASTSYDWAQKSAAGDVYDTGKEPKADANTGA